MQVKYQRVLLKLSGEALLGHEDFGFCKEAMNRFAEEIRDVIGLGVQFAIVLGGGNLFRGRNVRAAGLDQISADQIGMLATIMNALALRDTLEQHFVKATVLSARLCSGICEEFERYKAIHYLENGQVVLLAGGTGNPLVTTDSAASLRAVELKADILLKGTNVDGIYSDDPDLNPHATLYRHISYDVALQKRLAVMDLTAFSQCMEHKVPIRVFNIFKPGLLKKILLGEPIGTLVSNGE